MPAKSKAQQRFMWRLHPGLARKWAHTAKRKYGKRSWFRRLPAHNRKSR